MLIPILDGTIKSCPSIVIGSAIVSSARSATFWASCGPGRFSRMRVNSSLPIRAAVSFSRLQSCSRLATAFKTSSPPTWPRVSLISAKRSRLMNITATFSSPCRTRIIALLSCSWNRLRFGSPVSTSCVARWRRRSSAFLICVISLTTET